MNALARLTLAAAALAALPACAPVVIGSAATVGVMAGQNRSVGRGIDDATASNEIKLKLLNHTTYKFAAVDVEVADGLVLLSGDVESPEARIEAERIAWSVNRNSGVSTEIVVGKARGWRQAASDQIITARLRSRLIGARDIQSINYNIETHSGVVYLMGIAQSAAELQRAAQEASTTPGVTRVVSYVRIPEVRSAAAAATAPPVPLTP